MQTDQELGFEPKVENAGGSSPFVLVCEHASPRIPPELNDLGLSQEALCSHIGWDPGAYDTAKHLSSVLDVPLVSSTISRLVYDCNRPPRSDSAMPSVSETTVVPGNTDLSAEEKAGRVDQYYRPFEAAVARTLDEHRTGPILVTIHSFTPVFLGQTREVEIGFLHDSDGRLADALLDVADWYDVQRNAPYGPSDGVTHTLIRHGVRRGILNVMVEIRNDLLSSPQDCVDMADRLAGWLTPAVVQCAGQEAAQ